MKVKIKKLVSNAVIPAYAKAGDAGMDLTATSTINTEMYVEYGTGLAIEIPEGYAGLLFPRSSVSKTDLILANCIGLVDSSFRGEIKLRFKFFNQDRNPQAIYQIGDRIGQLVIMPYPKIVLEVVDELSDTERGQGGFGSTNA